MAHVSFSLYRDKRKVLFILVGQRPGTMSTRKIEVTRGLSVNLTWYFSKSACFIQEQEFGYSSGDRLAILAVKRQNESIQVAEEMPEQFKGRIAAAASSSTLIIHNVQFNDSIYQFASVIKARSFVVPQFISKTLLPRYILSVTGNIGH